MKIINLKVYGMERKTFVGEIEGCNVYDSDTTLKNKVIAMLHKLISALGFDRSLEGIIKDMEIIEITRLYGGAEDTILFTINVDNLA